MNENNSQYKVKIIAKEFVTHDVEKFVLEKPPNYKFTPGQATDISIDNEKWRDEKRSFTFTSKNSDVFLEFIIKEYSGHNGVTNKLRELSSGDSLIIGRPWGTIEYRGEGVFIAGGVGITPFIAILRDLKENEKIGNNMLIFSNKTEKDIILKKEFEEMFSKNPENLIFTLTNENNDKYENRMIDKDFLNEKIKHFSQRFYICGPPRFVKDIKRYLEELGAGTDSIIFEK